MILSNSTSHAASATGLAAGSTTAPVSNRGPRRLIALGALSLAFTLALGACGSSDDGAASDSVETPAAETPAADTSAAPVVVAANDLGDILVNADGMTLYGFTNDSKGTSVCDGGCAQAWPPVVVDSADLPAGLDAAVFSVIERSDGTHQLQAGSWPLYLFASDTSAGDAFGQASGDVWFVVDPDGGLIK